MTDVVMEIPRCFSISIRVPVGFARLHRTRDGDGLAHQQQLFGDGGLARVGVGNDGEGTALGDFGGLGGHG